MKKYFTLIASIIVLHSCSQSVTPNTKFRNIIEISKLTLPASDSDRLYNYLSDTLKKNRKVREFDLFVSQEFLDYCELNNLNVFGYLDWKSSSSALEGIIEDKIKTVHNDTIPYVSPIWEGNERADSLRFIEFPTIKRLDEYLRKRDYVLCNIDCDCDCYRVVVVKSKDVVTLQSWVAKLGCILELPDKEW